MRLTIRKLTAVAAGTLAAFAAARYVAQPPDAAAYTPVNALCQVPGSKDQPPLCANIDPSRFSFAALRGM